MILLLVDLAAVTKIVWLCHPTEKSEAYLYELGQPSITVAASKADYEKFVRGLPSHTSAVRTGTRVWLIGEDSMSAEVEMADGRRSWVASELVR